MCTPEHGDRVSFINFVPEQLSGRGHRPVLDTCANEAIPRWGKGGLINRLYLQLRPTQYPKMCCFHHGPNRESKPAQLLQSVFVLSGPVCLPSHQHVLSQSVCVCVMPGAWRGFPKLGRPAAPAEPSPPGPERLPVTGPGSGVRLQSR